MSLATLLSLGVFSLWTATAGAILPGCEDYLAQIIARVENTRGVRTDSTAPRSWAEHGEAWETSMNRAFRAGAPRDRLLAAARSGDPRIALMRRLGFAIDGERIVAPSFETMVARYEAILQEQILAGLPASNTIRPGRVYVDREGKHHIRGFRQEPEADWQIARLSELPGPVIGEMLAEGYFPATADHRAVHDFLGHLMGLLSNRHYMAGVRNYFHDLRSGDLRIPRGHRELRAMHVLEGFALVPMANEGALGLLLSPVLREAGHRLVTVEQLTATLATQTATELRTQARQLLDNYGALVDFYGGAVRDPSNTWPNEPSLQESFTRLGARLEGTLSSNNPRAIAADLARLEIALWESRHVTVESYFEGMRQMPLRSTSPLHRYFVQTGIGQVTNPGPGEYPHTPMFRSLTTGGMPTASGNPPRETPQGDHLPALSFSSP